MDYSRLVENFENVLEPKECELTGKAPEWLSGTMLRNGPGMFKIGDSEYNHWFDGMAYIQRYHFKDGKMWYSARYLESDDYKKNMAAQRIVCSSFGTYKFPDPCKNIFHRLFSYYFEDDDSGDNDSVAFSTIGDGVYALTETTKINRIDLDTLERLEKVDVNNYLTLNTYTAHHHSDQQGNTYNIGSKFGKESHYVFATTLNPLHHKSSSPHSLEHTQLVGSLPCSDPFAPGYYHSFGMSENYMVLFEAPVRINIKKMIIRKLMSYAYRDAFFWDETKETNVLIMDKRTGQPVPLKVTSAPFFTFHHANSFEKDGFLVMDYCRMENPGDFSGLSLQAVRSRGFQQSYPGQVPHLSRMIVPLSIPEDAKPGYDLLANCSFAGKCRAELRTDGSIHVTDMRICEEPIEFPRYNYEEYNMKEYSFVYGTNVLTQLDGKNVGIIKANVKDGTHIVWNRQDDSHMCAEPIFVRNPSGQAEDDGVLLVPVMTTLDGDRPFVVVLDSRDLSEIARYVIPEPRIPLGFHAHYTSR